MRFLQVTLFKNTLNTLFKKAKNSTLIFSQTNFDYNLQNTEPGNQQVQTNPIPQVLMELVHGHPTL